MAKVFFYVKTSREMFLSVYSTEVTGTTSNYGSSWEIKYNFFLLNTSQDEWELKDAQIPPVLKGVAQLLST